MLELVALAHDCFDCIIHPHLLDLHYVHWALMKDGPMQSFINSVYQDSHGAHAVPFGSETKYTLY